MRPSLFAAYVLGAAIVTCTADHFGLIEFAVTWVRSCI